jgi:restriction endonuclease S subunit
MSIINSKIFIIRWKDIEKWVIPRTSLVTKLPPSWSSPILRDLAKPVTHKERVESDKEYKMVGIRWYGEGLFHRETVHGSNLSSKWVTPVVPNAFIYNRLFAWKESFAVVPNEYNGYHVSSEFPQFTVDESIILPKYLYLIFTRRKVIDTVKRLSVGSSAVSRNRFKEQDFLSLYIPVPPLSTQQEIINFWEDAQKKAAELRQTADWDEKEIGQIVMQELGLKECSPYVHRGAFIVNYDDVERWDTYFFRKEFRDILAQLQHIGAIPLGKCAHFVSRKWTPMDFPKGFFNYIQISDVNKTDGIVGCSKVEVKRAPSRAAQVIRKGDLLISTTRPYLAAFAGVTQEFDGSVASSAFANIETTSEGLDKDFLLLFLKSYAGLKQFEQRMTGGLYPAIVKTELEKLLIPIPPFGKQRSIVEKVGTLQGSIKSLKRIADDAIAVANVKLEAVISGETDIQDVTNG